MSTWALEQLSTGISRYNEFICSDARAIHTVAALGRHILCLFGNSDTPHTLCPPRGMLYELIPKESHRASDITIDEALNGFSKLLT